MEHINNILRLEIDASDAINQISNHSAETNTTGWAGAPGTVTRATSSSNGYGASGTAIRIASVQDTSHRAVLVGPSVSIAPGQFVNVGATVRLSQELTPSIGVAYFNSSGQSVRTVLKSAGAPLPSNGRGRISLGSPDTAPAGATSARLVIEVTSPAIFTMHAWEAVMVISDTRALVTDTAFYSGPRWQNMLGSAYSLSLTRGNELDGVVDTPQVGTLTAVLSDPLFDPTKNPRIRPGRKVRVRYVNTPREVDFNQTVLWTGELTTIDVNYRSKRAAVTLQAVDVINKVQNIPVPQGYNGDLQQRLSRVLDGTGIPYFYTDAGTAVTLPKIIDVQENATALDQLTWIGVALDAFVHADYDGSIDMRKNPYASHEPLLFSDVPESVSDEISYTDIDTNFGSQALFNEFMVKRHNLDEEDGEKDYGPFTNAASKSQWGVRSVTIETNDGVPREIAERYGKVFANPEIFPSSLKFNARDVLLNNFPATNINRALNTLYYPVRIKHTPSGLDSTYRILNIEHEITPDSWEVTLGFRPVEASASVTITNPPGGPASGPGDLVQPEPGAHSRRFRNATFSVANATETGVPYNVVESQDGIPFDDTNRRWTVEKDGRYLVVASVGWAANATGTRVLNINVNGGVRARSRINGSTGGNNIQDKAVTLKLVAGDTVSVTATQSSGGALNISNIGAETFGAVTFLGG